MTSIHRFVIANNGKLQNFLKIEERKVGDLILSTRGKQHSVPVGPEFSTTARIEEGSIKSSSITIHPNLNSGIGSITINYKDNVGGNQVRRISGVLDVKYGQRLFVLG
jgi:hypothetical protein